MRWSEKPWERQDGESGKAYEAFAAYRDMGTGRTVSGAARQLRKSRTLLDRWNRQWKWDERVRAYDKELERAAHEEALQAVREMSRRHIDMAVQMQNKALEALSSLEPDAMRPKDIVAMAHEGVKIERNALTQILEDTVPKDDDAEEFPFDTEDSL